MTDELIKQEAKEKIKGDNCYDFMRYFFAAFLIVAHYFTLANIETSFHAWGTMRVKAFFIISGFLVFYSFINKPDIGQYINKRARRILPPYILVVFSCFVLGAFITSLSLGDYFTSVDTYKYLLANSFFMNFIEPSLPGVFDSPLMNNSAVNGSLWTMKVEVMFYISVPIVYYFLKRFNKLYVVLSVLSFAFIYEYFFLSLYEQTGNDLYLTLKAQFGSQFKYFYSGTLILLYFDKFIKYVKYLFPISILIYMYKNSFLVLYLLEPLSFATIIIGCAYCLKFLSFLRKYDNISYGMYLFHYPIIQCFVFYGYTERYPVMSFIAVFCITIFISIISWKFIEKPIIKKKYF